MPVSFTEAQHHKLMERQMKKHSKHGLQEGNHGISCNVMEVILLVLVILLLFVLLSLKYYKNDTIYDVIDLYF